ncbi:MAG: hypothetical protein NC191_01120 [Muribaculaceae bacterium]|nr:hypothetical protein [Muribaculaceae bacterium]
MFKIFKDSFHITNDCIILAIPLIIFMSILGWFLNYTVNGADTVPKIVLGGVTLLVMASGFLSSWLYMCKKAIHMSKKIIVFDKDRAKSLWTLILTLPRGIGRLFLPNLSVIGIYIILYGILIFISCQAVNAIEPTFDTNALWLNFDKFSTGSKIINDVNSLSIKELVPIACWHFIMIAGSLAIGYITMLWLPEIVYSEKNAFKALGNSIYKVFSNFKHTFLVYLYITILITAVMILTTSLMYNPLLYFFTLILYYYLLVYIIVLIFTYYEYEFK